MQLSRISCRTYYVGGTSLRLFLIQLNGWYRCDCLDGRTDDSNRDTTYTKLHALLLLLLLFSERTTHQKKSLGPQAYYAQYDTQSDRV